MTSMVAQAEFGTLAPAGTQRHKVPPGRELLGRSCAFGFKAILVGAALVCTAWSLWPSHGELCELHRLQQVACEYNHKLF